MTVSGQGVATQALITVELGHRRARCLLAGKLRMSLEREAQMLRVRGNPVTTSLPREARAGLIRYSWANWCGPRTRVHAVARYDGLTASTVVPFVADCVQRRRPAVLARGR